MFGDMEFLLDVTYLQWIITTGCILILTGIAIKYFLRATLDLSGKTCLITGASSGIGEALAHELVKHGCRVILTARSVDKLKSLKQQLEDLYKHASVIVMYLDVEDHDQIPTAMKDIMHEWQIDIVINNAGIASRDRVEDQDLKIYKKIMDVNFLGMVAVTKAVLPSMQQRKSGSFVMISSVLGRFAVTLNSPYSASKHAMQAFSDSLRFENIKNNIHVLVVSPSYVRTNIDQSTFSGNGAVLGLQRNTTQSGMNVKQCAEEIVDSLRNYQDELVVGPFRHKLIPYLRVLCFPLYKLLGRLFLKTEIDHSEQPSHELGKANKS